MPWETISDNKKVEGKKKKEKKGLAYTDKSTHLTTHTQTHQDWMSKY